MNKQNTAKEPDFDEAIVLFHKMFKAEIDPKHYALFAVAVEANGNTDDLWYHAKTFRFPHQIGDIARALGTEILEEHGWNTAMCFVTVTPQNQERFWDLMLNHADAAISTLVNRAWASGLMDAVEVGELEEAAIKLEQAIA